MPLYEYLCTACSERLEVIQKVSAPPLAVCPRCGGHLEKLLSAPALQFKGTGWYVTDYARSGKSAAGNGTRDASPGESSSPSPAPTPPASAPTASKE